MGALLVLEAAALLLATGGAAGPGPLVPASRGGWPGWLAGPLSGVGLHLDTDAIGAAWLVLLVAYVVLLARAHAITPRTAIAGIVALHLTALLAPPLGSADVFGYVDYARLGAIHHLDPYTHASVAAPQDPAYPWVGWHVGGTPYGPLFTAASYALAPLPVPAAVWLLKGVAAAASLGAIALLWTTVRRTGRDPVPAALLVGCNPLLLVHGVAGAHNDLVVAVLVTATVGLATSGRERGAGAVAVLAAAIKPSAGLLIPFLLAGTRRRSSALAGAAAAAAVVASLAIAVFGSHALGFLTAVQMQQRLVAAHSVPAIAGRWLGLGGVTPGVRVAGAVLLLVTLAVALARTWRGGDWVAAAGWATLALLVASAWLLPWYVVWVLPLAALGRDRRLVVAAVAMTAFIVLSRNPLLP